MKNRKFWVSLLAGILAAVMILSLFVGALPKDAKASGSSALKDQLEELQAQQGELADKIAALEQQQSDNLHDIQSIIAQKDLIDQQVALLHAEVANVNSQIATYSLLIADKQEELELAQKRLEELNKKNKERIRAMEEEGELSYWAVLFEANDFADLLDRLNMISEIAAADRRRLEEMSAAAQIVANAQAELASEKAQLELVKEALEESQAELDAKSAEADRLLAELVAVSEDLEEMHNRFEKEEEQFLNTIYQKEQEYLQKLQEEEESRQASIQESIIQQSIQESIEESIAESIAESIYIEESRYQEWLEESIQESIEESIEQSIQESIEESIEASIEESRREESTDSNPSGVRWLDPVDYYRISSPFGYRWHPVTGEWSFHRGVDMPMAKGTPIVASRSGIVTIAEWGTTAGNYVTINHEDGYSSVYMHMTHYIVEPGDRVKAGEVIGYVGSTGRSTGPHLHFGIHYYGEYVNPMDYLD